MAAGLGFKDFVTGEVLTAADVDGYLMQGIWVFANATARDAAVTSPQEGNACYLKDTDVIQVYSGSAWVVKSGGGSSGKLLQVVQSVTSTGVSVAGTTFADTGVTGTITPSATSSKILVMVSQTFLGLASAADEAISLKMLRGATEIFQNGGTGHYISGYVKATGATATGIGGTNSMIYLDSPSTTSATTYKIQGRNEKAGGTVYFQEQAASSTITLMEIGA